MFKLFTTKIVAAESSSNIGKNANYRTTVNYNSSTSTINVVVESVIRPDLTRDEEVEVTYETVAERDFTPADFPKALDNATWLVDFDVATKTITNPINIYDWMRSSNTGSSDFHVDLHTKLVARYSENYLPVLYLKIFDKNSTNFEHGVLVCYQVQDGITQTDSVLNSDVTPTNAESPEVRTWFEQNIKPEITYSVTDSSGSIVGTLTKLEKNRYRTSLPSGNYTVNVTCAKEAFASTENAYSVTMVNGVANKTRLLLADSTTIPVNLDLTGLVVGEYCKMKLNSGEFISYSELWIDIE